MSGSPNPNLLSRQVAQNPKTQGLNGCTRPGPKPLDLDGPDPTYPRQADPMVPEMKKPRI
jgi:hypothetical protein